jgi:hypothetical protein
MTHLATWADPVVRWDSKLYSWDGEPILSEDTADTLRQRSVFAQVASDRLVARIDAPRLVARIIPQALIARVDTQRLYARVTDGH